MSDHDSDTEYWTQDEQRAIYAKVHEGAFQILSPFLEPEGRGAWAALEHDEAVRVLSAYGALWVRLSLSAYLSLDLLIDFLPDCYRVNSKSFSMVTQVSTTATTSLRAFV